VTLAQWSCLRYTVCMKNGRRPRSIAVKSLMLGYRHTEPVSPYWRPETRADCSRVPRPCPYVGCQYNLYLDVLRSGSLKYNFPHLEPSQMVVSCVLDMAEDECGCTLEAVGSVMNLTRERVRQIEARALMKLERMNPQLKEFVLNRQTPLSPSAEAAESG